LWNCLLVTHVRSALRTAVKRPRHLREHKSPRLFQHERPRPYLPSMTGGTAELPCAWHDSACRPALARRRKRRSPRIRRANLTQRTPAFDEATRCGAKSAACASRAHLRRRADEASHPPTRRVGSKAPVPDPRAAIVNESLVTALASRGSFERGLAYLGEGRVGLMNSQSALPNLPICAVLNPKLRTKSWRCPQVPVSGPSAGRRMGARQVGKRTAVACPSASAASNSRIDACTDRRVERAPTPPCTGPCRRSTGR
ncbi:MAG: hypothetical protein QOH00_2859, partial [Gaiellales bacterium]|nr:hypothetical protein [Gaiellales bacterium]